MAMLHFALRHCQTHGLRRIIVVLPFLTLAEQTEKEYKELIPGLLVDHSQKDLPEEARELAARWDAPLVITTSVRFFESLFSDRPTACRKLHHIANDVCPTYVGMNRVNLCYRLLGIVCPTYVGMNRASAPEAT